MTRKLELLSQQKLQKLPHMLDLLVLYVVQMEWLTIHNSATFLTECMGNQSPKALTKN